MNIPPLAMTLVESVEFLLKQTAQFTSDPQTHVTAHKLLGKIVDGKVNEGFVKPVVLDVPPADFDVDAMADKAMAAMIAEGLKTENGPGE